MVLLSFIKYNLFMKTGTSIILLLYLSIGMLHGQQTDTNKGLPGKLVQDYFSVVQEYALVYNGKEYSRYEKQTTNHPYLVNAGFEEGTISFGGTVYPRLLMKLDLFRDELVLQSPNKLYPVVAEKERIDYILLNGYRIINPSTRGWQDLIGNEYIVLLSDNIYPVIKKYVVTYEEKVNGLSIEASFRIKERFYVVKENRFYPVKNKRALLNLFPDKKKELSRYAREQKLNFKKQPEQAFVTIVKQYEALNR